MGYMSSIIFFHILSRMITYCTKHILLLNEVHFFNTFLLCENIMGICNFSMFLKMKQMLYNSSIIYVVYTQAPYTLIYLVYSFQAYFSYDFEHS